MSRRFRSRLRVWSQAVLSVLVVFVSTASTAELAIWTVLGVNVWSYRPYYSGDPHLTLFTWMDSYEPHPYFGYVSSRFRERTAILDTRRADDYVIAIFGGSVAEKLGGFLTKN